MKDNNQKTIGDIPQMIKDIKLSNFTKLARMCWRLALIWIAGFFSFMALDSISNISFEYGIYNADELCLFVAFAAMAITELKTGKVSKTAIKILKG